MKRSEALRIIWEAINELEDGNFILTKLEEAGMLPPWTKEDKMCYCSMLRSCPGCSPGNYTPQWEPEDA
jgi:hypothetical protein